MALLSGTENDQFSIGLSLVSNTIDMVGPYGSLSEAAIHAPHQSGGSTRAILQQLSGPNRNALQAKQYKMLSLGPKPL